MARLGSCLANAVGQLFGRGRRRAVGPAASVQHSEWTEEESDDLRRLLANWVATQRETLEYDHGAIRPDTRYIPTLPSDLSRRAIASTVSLEGLAWRLPRDLSGALKDLLACSEATYVRVACETNLVDRAWLASRMEEVALRCARVVRELDELDSQRAREQ